MTSIAGETCGYEETEHWIRDQLMDAWLTVEADKRQMIQQCSALDRIRTVIEF